jgi:oxalate decarboxylase
MASICFERLAGFAHQQMETFASEEFTDVSLNQWLRRVPSEMLKAHVNTDKELAVKIPAEKLEVI